MTNSDKVKVLKSRLHKLEQNPKDNAAIQRKIRNKIANLEK